MKLRNLAGIAVIAIAAAGCGSGTNEPVERITVNGKISEAIHGLDAYKTKASDCVVDGPSGIYQRGSKITATDRSGNAVGEGTLLTAEYTTNPELMIGMCTWTWGISLPKTDEVYTLTFEGGYSRTGTVEKLGSGTTVLLNGA